jgi:hypothetical protein
VARLAATHKRAQNVYDPQQSPTRSLEGSWDPERERERERERGRSLLTINRWLKVGKYEREVLLTINRDRARERERS